MIAIKRLILILEKTNITRIPNAYSDPNILAEFIAGQLKNRISFRKAIKNAIELAEQADTKGVQEEFQIGLHVTHFYVNIPLFCFIIHLTDILYSLINFYALYVLYFWYHTLFLILSLKIISYSSSLHIIMSPIHTTRFFLTIVINSTVLNLLIKLTLYLINSLSHSSSSIRWPSLQP